MNRASQPAPATLSRTCLVIGADGGVGRVVAAELIARGHWVAGTVLGDSAAAQARDLLPGIARVHSIDLADAAAAERSLSELIESADREIDTVLMCAARMQFGPIETSDLAEWRALMDLNIVAPLAIYKAALPALRRTRGRLLFISSVAGRQGAPLHGAYTASKFGLEGLADAMRQEAALSGVKVILLEPGGIQTPMVDFAIRQAEALRRELDADRRALYDPMLANFITGARGALEVGALLDPRAVALAAAEAIEAPAPLPRYAVGAEAEALFAAIAAMADRERDALVSNSFTEVARS